MPLTEQQLIFVVAIVLASAWFLFLRPSKNDVLSAPKEGSVPDSWNAGFSKEVKASFGFAGNSAPRSPFELFGDEILAAFKGGRIGQRFLESVWQPVTKRIHPGWLALIAVIFFDLVVALVVTAVIPVTTAYLFVKWKNGRWSEVSGSSKS